MTSVLTAPSSATSSSHQGRAIRVGIPNPINKLDPRDAVDFVSAIVLAQIFDTPYVPGPAAGAAVKPVLFEPLRAEDGSSKHYSAAVKSGIHFSDGTPLTAAVAARSLRGASVLANKCTVEDRGERVWFTLKAPNPRFDLTLTQSGCAIVLDKALQLHGTGAYVFDHRPNVRLLQTAREVRLVRNPHYHGQSGAQEIIFHIMPADADGVLRKLIEAASRGDIDLTMSLSAADLAAHSVTGMTASMQPGNSTAALFFNTERRLLASREMRRGLALALDLHELAATVYERNPAAFIAGGALPPSMGRSSGLPRLDRTEASRLIDAAGGRGTRLNMLVPWAPRPYIGRPAAVAAAICRQLAAVGLTVVLTETKSSDEFFDALFGGKFDLALAGWIADTPDPADFFEALLWSQSIGGDNHANNSRWRHPATDAALQHFRTSPSDYTRQEIERILREEVPLVPLMYGQSTVVHSRRLRNVSVSTVGVPPLNEVAIV